MILLSHVNKMGKSVEETNLNLHSGVKLLVLPPIHCQEIRKSILKHHQRCIKQNPESGYRTGMKGQVEGGKHNVPFKV